MFLRKCVIPVVALAGVALAVHTVRSEGRAVPPALPVADPPGSPYTEGVAGAGIVEASTENIAIGVDVPGVVTALHVDIGDRVRGGDPLFTVDDRAARAELAVRGAALLAAKAELQRLIDQPRPEDLPPARARVAQAEAELADAENQLELWTSVVDKRAVSEDTLARRRYAVQGAEARLQEAKSQLGLLEAGAWAPELEIARAKVAGAESEVLQARTSLDRLTVKAPVDGQVLQKKIRLGEYAPAGVVSEPLMLLGAVETLHVRVDVDENDAWRVRPDLPATAFVRGNPALKAELRFVRIEPFVVPKRSLTGDSAERVDTRVLQVIYSFPAKALPVYVGQQMDVFIEAGARADTDGAKGV